MYLEACQLMPGPCAIIVESRQPLSTGSPTVKHGFRHVATPKAIANEGELDEHNLKLRCLWQRSNVS